MAVDDSNTKVLLHFNGTNNSTTFTDESGKVWTARGNAKISTAQSVFGGAAGLFDGTTDYIDTPDHADFNLVGLSAWTFDWRMRFSSLPANGSKFMVFSMGDDLTHVCQLEVYNNAGQYVLVWEVVNGSSEVLYDVVSITTNTWYHFAVVKNGSTYLFYKDGTRLGSHGDPGYSYQNYASAARVGAHIDNGFSHNGYIDEFRFSHVARWTGTTYTVPTAEYGPSSQSATINQVSETDTAQPIARRKFKNIAQVSENDIAQAMARSKQKAIGQVLETDLAQALSRIKIEIIAQVAENDLAQPITRAAITVNITQVSETDLAQGISVRKTMAVLQVIETDAAQSLIVRKIKLISQVTEIDAAQAVTSRKVMALGQAGETDLAAAITRLKRQALSQVLETDLAQAIAREKAQVVLQVNELDEAQPFPTSGSVLVLQVSETDLAQALFRAKHLAVAQSIETDLSQPITRQKIRLILQALESDLAQPVTLLEMIAAINVNASVTPVSRLGLIVGINADLFEASAGDVSIDALSVTQVNVNAEEDV